MYNNNKTVALLFGGRGYEHDISKMGADFVNSELSHAGYKVLPILITRCGGWFICDGIASSYADIKEDTCLCPKEDTDNSKSTELNKATSLPCFTPTFPIKLGDKCGFYKNGEIISVCAAIPLLHGEFCEDGRVQGALDCAGIPFVGCDTVCGAVACDKAFTKLIAEKAGLPVTEGIFSSEFDSVQEIISKAEAILSYPMFVKPTRLGSSVGAGIAHNKCELAEKLAVALKLGSGRVMVEKFIEHARELECAVLSKKGKLLFTDIGEITCKDGFYDYENKYSEVSAATVSEHASIGVHLKSEILMYAKRISEALGIKGFCRVDFLVSGDKIYFNEVNTFPGMTESSMFPRLTKSIGYPVGELLSLIIDNL